MLKRLRVNNFKSLINIVFEPGCVNLLTGRNNSGKTTLCQAFNFLRFSTYLLIADAAGAATTDRYNFTNTYLKNDIVIFECDCELQIEGQLYQYSYYLSFDVKVQSSLGLSEPAYSLQEEHLFITGGQFAPETALLQNTAGKVRLFNEGSLIFPDKAEFIETTAPRDVTMLNRLYDLQSNNYANVFKKYLASWQFYDLEPAVIRNQEAKQQHMILNPDGSNLSHVLFKLKNYDEQRYRMFVNIVKEIEPKLDALNFVPPSQDSVFMSMADKHNNRFSVYSISNGTLRFMAIAYTILLSTTMAEISGYPPPLVIIEEPENGIYVGHLKRLLELVEPNDTQRNTQFIFSSHSPYFIDLFDRYPDGVFVMKSDGKQSEIIKPGPDKVKLLLEDFVLGEAHFRELLG